MTSSQDKIRAASFVSRKLASADDVELIAAMLNVAAGDHATERTLSARQYDLLAAHRVLSLVPASWSMPTDRDLASDKRQLTLGQLKLVADARRVITHLTSDGIECRVLKGMATSELDYATQGLRTSGDIDLLVRPSDFDPALDSLARLGAVLPPSGRAGYVFDQEATPILESGTEIDIHYRITRTAAPSEALFENPIELPACRGLALSAELRLLHAASHLMFSAPGFRRLSGLADISALRSRHTIDLEVVRHHAATMKSEALVGVALGLERVLSGKPTDTDHWVQPNWLERASYARSSRNLLAEHALVLSYLDGPTHKARYLTNWAMPTRSAADKRGGLGPYFKRLLPERLGGQTGGGAI